MNTQDCKLHSDELIELKKDMESLRTTVHSINNNLNNINNNLSALNNVKIKNGDDMTITVTIPDIMQMLYTNMKANELTPEKAIKCVEDNIERIMPIVKRYEDEHEDEDIKKKNNKLQLIQNLISIISVAIAIFAVFFKIK